MRTATGARVRAEDLGLRTGQGTVYAGVGLDAAPGSLTVLRADSGGGRTSLLLTLAGRMRPTSGTLAVDGHELPRAARRVRGTAALALCEGVNDLDERLRVEEHLRERMLMRLRPAPRSITGPALAAAGLDGLDTRCLVGELSMADKRRLGVALALLDEPRLVLVDNADTGLGPEQQRAFFKRLRTVADTGPTVIAACADAEAARGIAEVVEIGGQGPPPEGRHHAGRAPADSPADSPSESPESPAESPAPTATPNRSEKENA
ncbi:ABC transporter ATP-binding protein [Nocardiopsis halophila]|uniref:ABC transporter ATP-binding protein n=1 Tax=Nocardiopsis halophila TaxID=141692 RepID=UPI00034A7C66|nr:ATP-binding cassette domain-containing protein [Nocardiopsis halophila]